MMEGLSSTPMIGAIRSPKHTNNNKAPSRGLFFCVQMSLDDGLYD